MEKTIQQTAQAFAMYIGQMVQHEMTVGDSAKLSQDTLIGVHTDDEVLFVRHSNGLISETDFEAKLILKPAERVTEAHCIEIARIVYPDSENWSKSMQTSQHGWDFLQEWDEEDPSLFGINYPIQKIQMVRDYLISKGYSLPLLCLDNQDPISAGIAIDQSTLNPTPNE